jgi:flagellin-like protein
MGNKRDRRGISNLLAVAILMAFVLVAAVSLALVMTPPGNDVTTSTVRVFGLVSTMGTGTRPMDLVFTDAQSGAATTAPISDGRYSVQLPNHKAYNVSLRWGGNYSWQVGSVDMDEMMVDMQEGSMMSQSYNVVQPTPDSEVWVNGTLLWQMVTSSPTAIKFTASGGQTFEASVVGRAFSIELPNMMTYEVNVGATNATGYTEWYYFHQLDVSAGINVVGLTVKLGS